MFYWILILVIIVLIYWGHIKGNHGQGSPFIYISQTYLYIILSFLIVVVVTTYLDKYQVAINFNRLILSFIVSIGAIVTMHLFIHNSIYLEHLIWLIFVICMGIIVYPIIQFSSTMMIQQNVLIVMGIMIVLSAMAYLDTSNYFSTMTQYLCVALLIVLLFEVSDMIFFSGTTNTRTKIYNVIILIIFAFFVLSDTQRLRQKAIQCGHSACIDYPIESTSIFLDILNIFTNVSSLRRYEI